MTHFKRVIEKNRKNMPSKFSVCGNLERDGWKQVCGCKIYVFSWEDSVICHTCLWGILRTLLYNVVASLERLIIITVLQAY